LALVLVIALLTSHSLQADEPGPGPLFDAKRLEAVKPVPMAAAVVGAGLNPGSGPWSALIALRAGGDDIFEAWSFRGVMYGLETRRAVGASTLFLNGFAGQVGGPSGIVGVVQYATLLTGEYYQCWKFVDPDQVVDLRRHFAARLHLVQDGKDVPLGVDETQLYIDALNFSHYTSNKGFAKAAQRDVTFSHVLQNMDRYRGTVMHIEGRLKRINRFDPLPEMARAGVNDLYEAWVFPEYLGGKPFCVRFTEWPAGLSRKLLGQPKIDLPIRVSFDGYLFKKFSYVANDGRNSEREAPMLLGHSPVLLADEGPGGQATYGSALIIGIVVGLALLILGSVGLTYWYRRIDNKIRRRILAAQSPEFIPPPPDAVPVAVASAQPVKTAAPTQAKRHTFPSRITFPMERGGGCSERGEGDSSSKDRPATDDPTGA
jgi:hypothetical protein